MVLQLVFETLSNETLSLISLREAHVYSEIP